ncbi:hypothetical protein T265_08165 [Opisthorchis viverrini]|uniref:Uncharacterized protein n=1 Tax=Opisthorchis viverrini TaxID=6198 RepID=A0A074ZEN2_OPIVI|nr:hypothetical protein T265_08165 [Opisthorchis viverrini]KER24127.1 hypothetical protein T265_08165 [Opisthorchis viverrini]
MRQTDWETSTLVTRFIQAPEKWSTSTVLGKNGNGIYEINVGKENRTRRINQIRPNHMQAQCREVAEYFQWDILLDTVCLDHENVRPLNLSQNITASHSSRPSRVQANPKGKNYDQIRAVRKQFQMEKRDNTPRISLLRSGTNLW